MFVQVISSVEYCNCSVMLLGRVMLLNPLSLIQVLLACTLTVYMVLDTVTSTSSTCTPPLRPVNEPG